MIEDFGIAKDEGEIAIYAGMVTSAFTFAEFSAVSSPERSHLAQSPNANIESQAVLWGRLVGCITSPTKRPSLTQITVRRLWS